MASQTGKEISPIQIFPNLSISKRNQTMKFGQLAENNMRNSLVKEIINKML